MTREKMASTQCAAKDRKYIVINKDVQRFYKTQARRRARRARNVNAELPDERRAHGARRYTGHDVC